MSSVLLSVIPGCEAVASAARCSRLGQKALTPCGCVHQIITVGVLGVEF